MIRKYLDILAEQPKPWRFLASRLLMRTELCRLMTIRRTGYRLRFYPSSLSAAMWISPHDRCDDEAFFRRYLRPGDTVIDVGANIGTLAIVAAQAVGSTGTVYAIEAHPRVFGFLVGNLALNKVENVEAIHCALGERSGEGVLSSIRSDDQNRMMQHGAGVTVPLRRLDELAIGNQPIQLLKLDVEGYEKFVLEGSPRILEQTECVYFESYDAHCQQFGHRAGDVVEILKRAGLHCFAITGPDTLSPVTSAHRSPQCENLLALRTPDAFAERTGFWLCP